MEQSCYKCGQWVEQGRPFCLHCGAPQIRVLIPEPVAAGTPLAGEIAASQSPLGLPSSQTAPLPALPVQWSQAVKPCAIAALIAAVVMVLKLVVPLIAATGAGFLAVALYRRQHPLIMIRARIGARLGAVCGFFCFCLTMILATVRIAILHEGEEIRRTLLDALQQQSARYSDPQFQASLDFMRTPAGLAFMMAFLAIFALVFFLLLGTLGGALGGAALGRRGQG